MNIIGRLTRDAQVHTLPDERQVVNFSVAVNDSYKKGGERISLTEYFDCAYWIGVGISKFLTKGTLVELTGRVSAKAWLTASGEPKAGLNFHTSEIRLFGGGTKAEENPEKAKDKTTPASNKTSSPKAKKEDKDDDLPF